MVSFRFLCSFGSFVEFLALGFEPKQYFSRKEEATISIPGVRPKSSMEPSKLNLDKSLLSKGTGPRRLCFKMVLRTIMIWSSMQLDTADSRTGWAFVAWKLPYNVWLTLAIWAFSFSSTLGSGDGRREVCVSNETGLGCGRGRRASVRLSGFWYRATLHHGWVS